LAAGDYRDIMAGIDAMVKQYPIDPKRIGIRGHSYGGYMTMWAETQTRALSPPAVAGAGLSDWLSYYGLNDIDEWMIPFFGASVYDDPRGLRQKRSHALRQSRENPDADSGRRPRMAKSPWNNRVEWWHALATLHVPTKLVVYPNEGHMFIKPRRHA